MPPVSHVATWAIAAITIALILIRPRGLPEWCSALAGAAGVVAFGLLPAGRAVNAVLDGLDVYLFLAGMLALSELARAEGVFEWLAAAMARRARGSTAALFAAVFLAGIAVTALLSNDGTILLLTPAALAATRQAGVSPLAFVYTCAFVANAASFVLPISNPANLLLFGRLPTLGPWLAAFALPSLAALSATFAVLWLLNRDALGRPHTAAAAFPALSTSGKTAGIAVAVSALLLVACAGIGWPVGRAAFILGGVSLLVAALSGSASPRTVLREAPWSIVPLVAGLFVLVAALDRSGVLKFARGFFRHAGELAQPAGNLFAGGAIAIADNVFNNLPVGVLARYSVHAQGVSPQIAHAALVAVDLGPNLSVTGSLATLLWLMTIRREGIDISPWRFLGAGALVTIPALTLALIFVH